MLTPVPRHGRRPPRDRNAFGRIFRETSNRDQRSQHITKHGTKSRTRLKTAQAHVMDRATCRTDECGKGRKSMPMRIKPGTSAWWPVLFASLRSTVDHYRYRRAQERCHPASGASILLLPFEASLVGMCLLITHHR